MAITPIKALLVLLGGTAAAVATAYLSGALDPFLSPPPATVVSLPAPAGQQPPAAEAPKTDAPQMEAPKAEAEPSAPPAVAGGKQDRLAPSFDLLRVEPDGSVVIAGRAAPNARVELLVADQVIGEATAGADGDFAIVLDKPLEPGDYQIALRATGADGAVTSPETAIVSVPKTPDGQVLAMVEAPGRPAEVITAPKPEVPAAVAQQPAPAGETQAATAPAAEPAAPAPAVTAEKPAEKPADAPAVASAMPEQKPAASEPPAAASAPAVRVEAVEIDGGKIFVAGVAEAGRVVRGYANEILLGDAKAAPDGSFLIEAERELPVGNYMIRADVLDQSGGVVQGSR
ncbi:MAG: Ig-like domain-containing protein, partial [Rhizobiaceae bacterium]